MNTNIRPKILLIRPTLDSEIAAKDLRERHYQPLISPLLEVNYLDDLEIEPAEHYAFTSQNSARFFGRHVAYTSAKLFSIGEKTTAVLKNLGFKNIKTADGDADSLLELIQEKISKDESIAHLSGRELSVDIAAELRGKGYKARQQTVYETNYIEDLSGEAVNRLKQGHIFSVLLYSSKSAEAFRKAVPDETLSSVHAVCLSDAVLKEIEDLGWKSISVSSSKTTESMIDRLDQIRITCQNESKTKAGSHS